MIKSLYFIVCGIFIFISNSGYSATRYWVGGTGNWTQASAHWASTSGGSPAAGNLPTSSDDIIFDSNSGTGTVTVNSAVTVVSISFSSSCSAITMDVTSNTTSVTSTASGVGVVISSGGSGTLKLSGGTLTITNNLWVSGGTLQLNSGTLNVNSFDATGTVGLILTGGTVNCAGATINIGDYTNEVLSLNSGTLSVSSGTINIRTEFYTLGGTFNLSGGTMNVNVSSTSQRFYSFSMFNTTYNLTGGVIDIKNVASSGIQAVWIDASNSPGTLSGGIIRMSVANGHYTFEAATRIYSLEINHSAYTCTLVYNNLNLAGNFTLTAGTFDVSTYDISVAGNWTFTAGTFNSNSRTVTFNGSSAQQITGASASTFYNLTLNNSNGLTLSPSAGIKTTVKNTLTLTSGKITLSNYDLNIGATGISGSISGASSSNYIICNGTGVLRQYNIGTGQRTTVLFPLGINSASYTPVTLNVVGATTTDNFSVLLSRYVLYSGTSGLAYTSYVVDRTWNVTEGTTGGSNVTLTLQWNGSDELTSFSRSNCYISHYSSSWSATSAGSSASGSNPYTITSGTVTSFSPFAIASNAVLPIELLYFNVIQDQARVKINWCTAVEVNNSGFDIERSADGTNYQLIDRLSAAGNSYDLKNYERYDMNPLTGFSYYRLKQYDADATVTYSAPQPVVFLGEKKDCLYPNPCTDYTKLYFESTNDKKTAVYIHNEYGKLVDVQFVEPCENGCEWMLFMEQFPAGIYFVSYKNEQLQKSAKLIKQ